MKGKLHFRYFSRTFSRILITLIILCQFLPFTLVCGDDERNSAGANSNITATNDFNSHSSPNENKNSNSITIGGDNSQDGSLTVDNNVGSNSAPTIREAFVYGDFNRGSTGPAYFSNIQIRVIGDNLTDDNFLSPDGLHWSDRTTIELISGSVLGNYDFSAFPSEAPNRAIAAYSINNGDSGRITHVGQTRSGIDLDLIWTVIDSDKDDWRANSGFAYTGTGIKGIAFTGEQYFPRSAGNSISVLYNSASNIAIKYKIVKHGTFDLQPVIVSFISTDIDSAQGVETDLANIIELIPPDSNLVKSDGIIYDNVSGVVNVNGSSALPRGGYLGAGFISEFTYIFYSPAPQRVHNSYYYPIAARYDIFGSGLQADILTRLERHIKIEYVDKGGNKLKKDEFYKGFNDEKYTVESIKISNYRLVDIKKDETDPNHIVIRFIYAPEHKVKLSFVDEDEKELEKSKEYVVLDGEDFSYVPPAIRGYMTPERFNIKATHNVEHRFVYKKVPQLSVTNTTLLNPAPQGGNFVVNRNVPSTSHFNTSQPTNSEYTPVDYSSGIDWFLHNTNMSETEKIDFIDYINWLEKDARSKYGNDIHKINHAIANGVAYPVYAKDRLQNLVNDFGDKPKYDGYNTISRLLEDIYGEEHYAIDFPHLAMPLATAEKSSTPKEIFKWFGGLGLHNLLLNFNTYDNFYMLNSITGDDATYMDKKDHITDMDALIFHYHPRFKDRPLNEVILEYYNIPNLDAERENMYGEVLKKFIKRDDATNGLEESLINLSKLSIGFVGLWLIFKYKKLMGEKINITGSRRPTRKEIERVRNENNVLFKHVTTAGISPLVDVAKGIKSKHKENPKLRRIYKPVARPKPAEIRIRHTAVNTAVSTVKAVAEMHRPITSVATTTAISSVVRAMSKPPKLAKKTNIKKYAKKQTKRPRGRKR